MSNIIILDSGTLINFSINSFLDLFEKLKKKFNVRFLITEEVRYEVIKKPINMKKFELGAIRIESLLKENILELPFALGLKEEEIKKITKDYLFTSNHLLSSKKHFIHLIDRGEASCLALSRVLDKKGIKNAISIDERTTRMLCENPERLLHLMEIKFHSSLKLNRKGASQFSRVQIIRSTEIAYLAYKNNLIEINSKNALEAILYAIKYKGCSISKEEIEQMKEL